MSRGMGKSAKTGAAMLALMALLAMLGPLISPHDPLRTNLSHRLEAPSLEYPLGTDRLGRCQASRLLVGARYSLGAAMAASALALVAGACLGLLAGMSGPRTESLTMRLVDMALAFPGLILALVITGVMGPSLWSVCLGAAAAGWAWWARFVRGLTASARSRGFVRAGRVVGVRGPALLRRYILPQLTPPVLVAASLKTGWMIIAISGLSYLGLGAQPPTPEWGAMLQESRLYMTRAPWLMLAPGLAVSLTVLACNMLAEGLRDAMDLTQDAEVQP